MPSRILKDSILTDKAFNSLSLTEESIYHRLVVSADDYGVFYADPVLLLRILYPRKTDISEEAVRKGLDHLEEAGFIRRYTADGEDYLKILPWEKHQRLRNGRHSAFERSRQRAQDRLRRRRAASRPDARRTASTRHRHPAPRHHGPRLHLPVSHQ